MAGGFINSASPIDSLWGTETIERFLDDFDALTFIERPGRILSLRNGSTFYMGSSQTKPPKCLCKVCVEQSG